MTRLTTSYIYGKFYSLFFTELDLKVDGMRSKSERNEI